MKSGGTILAIATGCVCSVALVATLFGQPPPLPVAFPAPIHVYTYVTNYVTNWFTLGSDPTNATILLQVGEVFQVRAARFTENGKTFTKDFETTRLMLDCLPQRDIKVGEPVLIPRGRGFGVFQKQ
jgi:hypothetical protein